MLVLHYKRNKGARSHVPGLATGPTATFQRAARLGACVQSLSMSLRSRGGGSQNLGPSWCVSWRSGRWVGIHPCASCHCHLYLQPGSRSCTVHTYCNKWISWCHEEHPVMFSAHSCFPSRFHFHCRSSIHAVQFNCDCNPVGGVRSDRRTSKPIDAKEIQGI